jgi:hypothetical protein
MSQAWFNLNTQLIAHNKSFKSLAKKRTARTSKKRLSVSAQEKTWENK